MALWRSCSNSSSNCALALSVAIGLLGFGSQARAEGHFAARAQIGPDGRPVDLKPPISGLTALIFYSTECPISNAYSPTLNRIAGSVESGRARLVGVCVDPDITDAEVIEHAREYGLKFPVIRDRNGRIAREIGAKVTPEAFVIDANGKIRYHGRIDDQYAARQKPNANPTTHELADAVQAVLAGREIARDYVEAVGCPIPELPSPASGPTFANNVARILQRNCQECHRKGQVGPFALETYEQARKRASDIADVVEERVMPPWKPVAGVGPKLKHVRTLSDDEITTLVNWAQLGAPLGDPAAIPPSPTFSDDWSLGTPDLVIEPSESFSIPADGGDLYRCFVIPTNLAKDMAISAIEYRPDNRRVVHHMLAYVDISGQARKRDAADPGPGYACFSGPQVEIHGDLGGWAPGNEPSKLPAGIGRALPRGADVVIQVHYHPNGKPETDRSRIGLYFSREPVRQTLHWNAAAKLDLDLPPGESNIEALASWTAPIDLEAYAITPHMHLLGRDMRVWVKFPDGRRQDLVEIADWDFAWQNTYVFEHPIDLPKGSEVQLVAHFDNSAANPRNPNSPPRRVRWGEATTDEMCIAFIAVTKKGQDLTRPGEKDDLNAIFAAQNNERHKRYEEEARRRAGKDQSTPVSPEK